MESTEMRMNQQGRTIWARYVTADGERGVVLDDEDVELLPGDLLCVRDEDDVDEYGRVLVVRYDVRDALHVDDQGRTWHRRQVVEPGSRPLPVAPSAAEIPQWALEDVAALPALVDQPTLAHFLIRSVKTIKRRCDRGMFGVTIYEGGSERSKVLVRRTEVARYLARNGRR